MSETSFDPATALNLKACRNRMRGRGGKKPHVETLRRYITAGCKLPRGQRVKLKATRYAGEWLVMAGWLADFEKVRLLGGMA